MKKRVLKRDSKKSVCNGEKKHRMLYVVLAVMFCFTSCASLEMRDVANSDSMGGTAFSPELQQAERHNEVEKKEEPTGDQTSTETEKETESSEKSRVTLSVSGGVVIDHTICADAASRAVSGKEYSFLTMYSGVYPLIHDVDMAVGVLNSPAADTKVFGISTEEYCNMPIESLQALKDLGFDVLNVAGQNMLDCGSGGLLSTVENVCESGVLQIGAYVDEIDANDIRVLDVKGIKVASIAFSEEAGKDVGSLVVHNLSDYTKMASVVQYAETLADVVVVSVNWKQGADSSIRPEQKEAAVKLAEAGADIIVGSNGYCLQTAEWLETGDGGKSFVAYSLGNILDSGDTVNTLIGGILRLDIVRTQDGISLENACIVPTVTHINSDGTGYQVAELTKYADELIQMHRVPNLSKSVLYSSVRMTIPGMYLPDELAG